MPYAKTDCHDVLSKLVVFFIIKSFISYNPGLERLQFIKDRIIISCGLEVEDDCLFINWYG